MTFFYFSFVIICSLVAGSGTGYNYDDSTLLGPSNWGVLFPSECSSNRQSPIDINTISNYVLLDNDDACESGYFLDVDLDHSLFKIENKGTQVALTPVDSLGNELTSNTSTIARLTNLLFNSPQEYCFNSLHFHLGPDSTQGSEHYLNGEQYSLEAHFVFYSCDFGNLGAALADHNAGTEPTENLAVIGIFFDVADDDNNAFDPLVDNVEDITDAGDSITLDIDFSAFFGGEDNIEDLAESLFLYEGSLTTPTCARAVQWHVSDRILGISQEQLDELYTVKYDADSNFADFSTFGNFRPIQDLEGRTVYKVDCQDEDESDDDDDEEDTTSD